MADRKVSYARLQGVTHIPNVGQIKADLIPVTKGSGTVKELSMTCNDNVLKLNLNGKEIIVPLPMVQLLELIKE